MRLLILTQRVDRADADLGFFFGWLEAFARNASRVTVLALEQRASHLPSNVQVYSAGREQGRSRRRTWWRFATQLQQLLLREKCDAVFVHMCPEFVLLAAPLAMMARMPVTLWYAHHHASLRLWWAHRVARHIVTPLPNSFPLRSRRVHIVGHGIDVARFQPADDMPDDDAPLLLAAGRLTPMKRYEVLLEAVHLLQKDPQAPAVRVLIVGAAQTASDQVYRALLDMLIHRWSLEDVVSFGGAYPPAQMPALYRQCAALVSASPNPDKVIFEALAAGRPAFVTNAGFADVLGEDASSLLCRSGSAAELAAQLVRWFCVPQTARRVICHRLQQRVAQLHSLDHLMQQLLEIWIGPATHTISTASTLAASQTDTA